VKVVDGKGTLEVASTPPATFKALVNDVERDAAIVYETAAQLFYEEQVGLLWVMYNSFSTTGIGADHRGTLTPPSPPEGPNGGAGGAREVVKKLIEKTASPDPTTQSKADVPAPENSK
jgi:hypothetical protein